MSTQQWKDANKEKLRKSRLDYYYRNQQSCGQSARSRVKVLRRWVAEQKAAKGCSRCPENHPACLDYHHVNSAEKSECVATGVRNGWSQERLKSEMDKCVILCANCHRKEHWNEREVVLE